jgi:hypothetical protein
MKDWNELTIEESVHHLRKRFGVDSSGDAKCIFKLIEFYNDVVKNNGGLTDVMPSVIYLVTNEDKMTVESAHYKLEDAKKEVDDWAKHKPQFTFMVVETEIH